MVHGSLSRGMQELLHLMNPRKSLRDNFLELLELKTGKIKKNQKSSPAFRSDERIKRRHFLRT